MKYAYYCPACKSFWQSESTTESNVQPCGTCGGAPLFTGFSVDNWKGLSQAEKDAVCAKLAEKHNEMAAAGAPTASRSFGWIKGLRVFSWFTFAGIIIAGIVLAVFAGDTVDFDAAPFLIILGAILLAFCFVAGMMVFLGMAEDIRAIRNTIDEKKQ